MKSKLKIISNTIILLLMAIVFIFMNDYNTIETKIFFIMGINIFLASLLNNICLLFHKITLGKIFNKVFMIIAMISFTFFLIRLILITINTKDYTMAMPLIPITMICIYGIFRLALKKDD